MDPASVPFPPPQPPPPPPLPPPSRAPGSEDQLSQHDIHHHSHHSRQPHHFRVPTLSPHNSIDLSTLDPSDPLLQQHIQRLHGVPTVPVVQDEYASHSQDGFDREPNHAHMLQHSHNQSTSDIHRTPLQHHASLPPPPHSAPPAHGQFGILTHNAMAQPNAISQIQQDEDMFAQPGQVASSGPEGSEHRPHGQLVNRIVVDPPDLQAWREKLFNVDDTIILTNDQFETYFPHIDNVYSHRSTQKYKRKPFISHYWDCRMKGRPPGTPKSDDPSKKKRKRSARERDLCDVKIKITEYFPGATILPGDGDASLSLAQSSAYQSPQQQMFGDGLSRPMDAHLNGEKFWTIQRVNGNGGNGKGDGVAGPHKHSLEKSDEIKKSTVQRYIAAQEKEAKKIQKPLPKRMSGAALATAKKHSKEHDLKLYAACFCPFSQRVWIALEAKGMQYQYCETDPFKRPTQLLEANPRGLVPAIREGDWASGESAIILEYLEDHDRTVPLFPTDPRLKANCRLWIDHINARIVPAFFALAKTTDFAKQSEYTERLRTDITALVQAADERGPYFLGGDLCLVDIHFAPFVLRMSRILRELRNWGDPMPGTRWQQWAEALEQNPHIQATTSQKELYVETLDLFLNTRQPHGECLPS
ncbi:hypothetical protein F5Y04DRAFT_239857 [Hypomontagnella monticulosa]|nr:hypothetical protein F5Y04DRAFT_239857 [Hypomontagnella monticulosa]